MYLKIYCCQIDVLTLVKSFCAVAERTRLGSVRPDGETDPVRYVCEVCKELLPDEQGLADHVEVAHGDRNKSTENRSEGYVTCMDNTKRGNSYQENEEISR